MTSVEFEITVRGKNEVVSTGGISLKELSRLCECHHSVILRLYQAGLFDPVSLSGEPLFDRDAAMRIRKALRLKRDLNLNIDAVAVVMELLDRIQELERRLKR